MHTSLIRMLCVLCLLFLSVAAQAKLNLFACEPEWAALASEIAGEHANVFAATHAGQDPHHVEARPSLIARLRSADLAVCTGAQLEAGWMPMLQRRARNPKVRPGQPGYLEAAQQVELLEIPTALDRAEGDVHGDGNPHIQLDPRRLLEVAKALSLRLQTIDPANSTDYHRRLRQFTRRWQEAITRWQELTGRLKGKRVVVQHRAWTYLPDWLDMQRVGSLEPKPGIPPSLSHLSDLKQQPADLIIVSPLNDTKPSAWLHVPRGLSAVEVIAFDGTLGPARFAEKSGFVSRPIAWGQIDSPSTREWRPHRVDQARGATLGLPTRVASTGRGGGFVERDCLCPSGTLADPFIAWILKANSAENWLGTGPS